MFWIANSPVIFRDYHGNDLHTKQFREKQERENVSKLQDGIMGLITLK